MEVISETTAVSIGLILSVIGALLSFVIFMVRVYIMARGNEKQIKELSDDYESLAESVKAMDDYHKQNGERLVRVETLLTEMMKKVDRWFEQHLKQ